MQDAIRIAGSQSAFARLCGVSQTAVWKWVQKGGPIPAKFVLLVERKTGVSRHLLEPNIYPTEPSSSPCGGAIPSVGPSGSIVPCDRAAFSHRNGDA
ncbi:transcriptional regulator [Sphingomonas sp. SORGH_AS_0438]|uniref:transcriptional regulator n=1 Tax=Sphingomonas sp. SORGH_AS_0438 TaxID=3041756 RepID=UPI0038673AC8